MAIIESGDGSQALLTIDPTSKAARMEPFDTNGERLLRAVSKGIYYLPIGLRFGVAVGSGTAQWYFHNNNNHLRIYMLTVFAAVAFEGTPAASTSRWGLSRFTSLFGTAVGSDNKPPIALASAQDPSAITVAKTIDNGSGLNMTTGVVNESYFAYLGCQRRVEGHAKLHLNAKALQRRGVFELSPGAGFAFTLVNSAVIGDSLLGYVCWEEVIEEE